MSQMSMLVHTGLFFMYLMEDAFDYWYLHWKKWLRKSIYEEVFSLLRQVEQGNC